MCVSMPSIVETFGYLRLFINFSNVLLCVAKWCSLFEGDCWWCETGGGAGVITLHHITWRVLSARYVGRE